MIPKLFAYCQNFNNRCEKTKEIQGLFAESIKLKEFSSGRDIEEEPVNIAKTIEEVAKKYCSECDNFVSTSNNVG